MLHLDIKEQIKDAMRAHDELRKEVLRGILTALSTNSSPRATLHKKPFLTKEPSLS